jgi:hypothetical protein
VVVGACVGCLGCMVVGVYRSQRKSPPGRGARRAGWVRSRLSTNRSPTGGILCTGIACAFDNLGALRLPPNTPYHVLRLCPRKV